MTELEKVVKRLECEIDLLRDALDLLKAQMPRVMTVDEIVENVGESPMFIEYPGGAGVSPVIYQPDSFEDDGYLGFGGSWRTSGFYHKFNYGRTWRCWTARPTDEQMASTPWEEEENA